MSTSKSQRTILTEDGELRQVDVAPESTPSDVDQKAVFCNNCGTANQAHSRFCRGCGQSLDEQTLNPASLDQYAPPERKNKRLADRGAQPSVMTPQDRALMIEVMTMIVLGALAAVAIASQQAWMALVILGIWIALRVLRHKGEI